MLLELVPSPAEADTPDPDPENIGLKLGYSELSTEQKLLAITRLATEALLEASERREIRGTVRTDTDYEVVASRFAAAVEDNNRLRNKRKTDAETIRALQAEVGNRRRREIGLQEELRQLREALQNPAADDRVFRQLDRIVREIPTARGA